MARSSRGQRGSRIVPAETGSHWSDSTVTGNDPCLNTASPATEWGLDETNSVVHGFVRLKSSARILERISGWFRLLMFGESQSKIEFCQIRKRIGLGEAASQV
jgi:hypothetical protein